jgi:hypothetical protein
VIERRAELPPSYARLRLFLETEDLATRRLTAEWLAGRLVLPLRECAQALDRLANEGVVQRRGRLGTTPWFEIVPPASRAGLRHFVLGVLILAVSAAIVALSTLLHHVFFFAVGLALGLLIAFAWLDWELRARI